MTWIRTVPEGEASGVLKEVYDAWTKLLAFAEKLTVATHTITEAHAAGLHAAGFSDIDILDITLLTCYRHFINRLSDALGVELDEGFKKDPRLVAGIEAAMGVPRP